MDLDLYLARPLGVWRGGEQGAAIGSCGVVASLWGGVPGRVDLIPKGVRPSGRLRMVTGPAECVPRQVDSNPLYISPKGSWEVTRAQARAGANLREPDW